MEAEEIKEVIEIDKLKVNPDNIKFFDDITGDGWKDFLESIKRRGVIEPVVVTQDYVIVSGHQRIRACKELGIKSVACRVRHYNNDDEILEDLIESNLKQRVIGNSNPMKLSKCISELERIYGISHGGDRKSSVNNSHLKTQDSLAKEFGMDESQLRNYKKLLTLIPEFQDAIEKGKISPTIGYKILAKLSKKDQEQLLEKVGGDYIANLSQRRAETLVADYKNQYMKEITVKNDEINTLKNKMSEDESKIKDNKNEIEEKDKIIAQNKKSFAETREKIHALMNKPADEKSQKEIEVLKIQNESRQKDIQKLQQDNEKKDTENANIKKELADAQRKLIDAEQIDTKRRSQYKLRMSVCDLKDNVSRDFSRVENLLVGYDSSDKYLPEYANKAADELERVAGAIRNIGNMKGTIQYEE